MSKKKQHKHSTDTLIKQLVKNLSPVKPRPSLFVSFTVLLGAFFSLGFIYCLSLGIWFNSVSELINSWAFTYTLFCFITTICALTLVLKLSVPGKKTHVNQYLLISLGLSLLIMWFWLHNKTNPQPFFYVDPVFSCSIKIVIMTGIPSLISWYIASKAYILNKIKTALICIISGTCLALCVIFLHCPILDGMHLLQWHFIPVLSLLFLAYCSFVYVKHSNK